MAARGEFAVGLICPPAWAGSPFEPAAGDGSYWLRRVPIVADGRNHFHVYRGLAAAIREFRPDVLNVEEEHYSLVTWQCFRIAARRGAAPLFYTWQNIRKAYPPPFSWIERRVFRDAAAAVCGNDEAIQVLRAKGYRGPAEEIPQMGVNLSLFAPGDSAPEARQARQRALGLAPGGTWVAFAGRIVAEKGLDTLLEALVAVPSVRALILGRGPSEPALKERAAALGVAGRVRWEPQVPSAAVAAYLKAVDVLCLPSRTRPNWKEQFGRVLIEAMAAEAVVIGSSSGEIPRVIADCGLVFPEGDAPALAAQLRAAARPETAAALRAKAARRVRALYTNDVVADRLAALFRAAAARQRPK